MGFTLSHFISQIHPRDLFRLLAIGMCHLLPVHHFVMAFLAGSKAKIQQSNYKYYNPAQIIISNAINSFAHSQMVPSIAMLYL